ncbi:dienelactone hydrolase family protein [Geodermatophilus marinus]|uniref:dienelactone hydrolase family protein n=1 Tax=Geodermatophilus sp. LHW52908 TaxID=2303986 RepID=UPI000E3BAEA3|nr:dienelactone hydrolase family protein [Geodermatophilus sp. LHW52908]RFU19549.1 dienelactone hydrolase family protein [Geodermatophilus sp. LHW52908]
MCHDPDSRPPAPPRSGPVGERGLLTLTAADGTEVAAALAAPSGTASVGVVLLPDVRGLHPYYVALAERFAEAGLPAVAVDWFGRTAGVPEAGTRGPDFDWQEHVPRVTAAGVDSDVTAAIAHLRGRDRPDLPVVVVGFCFGGSHAWRLSGGDVDLAACVGFYGRPALVGDVVATRPTLLVVAGADAATPVEDQLELAGRLRTGGAEVETAVYDGAPHSFFDRAHGDWAEACADVWRRVLALTDRVAADRGA